MAEEIRSPNLRLHVSILEDTALLTDEEFGRLVRYGLHYLKGDADRLPPGQEGLFVPLLRRYIDTDNDRYIAAVEQRREASRKRWKKDEDEGKREDATACDRIRANPKTQNTKHITDIPKGIERGADAPTPSPKRHKHGNYGHVLLEEEQLRILQREFPEDWKDRIQRVDDYCESTGKTYKNYLQTIRNWARRDGKDIDPNTPSANGLVAATLRRKA